MLYCAVHYTVTYMAEQITYLKHPINPTECLSKENENE